MSERDFGSSSRDEYERFIRKNIEPKARQMHQLYASGLHVAGNILDGTDYLLSGAKAAPLNTNWGPAMAAAKRLEGYIDRHISGMQSTDAAGTAFSWTAMVNTTATIVPIVEPQNTYQIIFWQSAKQLTVDQNWRDQALGEMQRMRLESREEGRNAIKQFTEAWNIYMQRLSSGTPSALTIRSSIDNTWKALLKLRPIQRAVPNKEYIIAIGDQLMAQHASQKDFEKLQQKYKVLHGELSGDGKKGLGRESEERLIIKATLFLTEFLRALDSSKVKS